METAAILNRQSSIVNRIPRTSGFPVRQAFPYVRLSSLTRIADGYRTIRGRSAWHG
jgi:hypothetical protein